MVEKKSFYEEFKGDKPESFEQEVFVANKSKKPIYFAVVIVLAIAAFGALQYLSQVEVPDMMAWNVSEVNAWAKKNDITMIGKQTYTTTVAKDVVVDQGLAVGEKIKKKGSIEMTFSKGANPDEAIALPELKNMKLEEIQSFIKDKQLTGVNIQYENSESIDKGTVMSVKFVDGDISNFVRKNRVKVTVSKGTAELTETLTMPDLYGQTKQQVLKWAGDNKVKVALEESYSDYIEANYVVSQSVTKDNKFNRQDTVNVVISMGQSIAVPDFRGLTSSEASALAGLYDLRLFTKSVASEGEGDRIVYQSIDANEAVKKNAIITLHVSKASTVKTMPDFQGLTKAEAAEVVAVHGLKVIYKTIESTEKGIRVVGQDIQAGSRFDAKDILTLTITDQSILVPDFKGMDKAEALAEAEDLGFKVVTTKVLDAQRKSNKIIKQDLEIGSIVKKDSRLVLDYADNLGVKVADLTTMNKADAEFWAKTKGFNLRIIETYHDRIAKGKLYNQNFKDIYLPESEPIVVYLSLGPIELTNMVGQSKADADQWVKTITDNGGKVNVEYRYVSSSSYAKGQITSQKPLKKILDKDEKVIFYVCSAQTSPTTSLTNFTGMTSSAFINWCTNNNVSYTITDAYDNTAATGTIYGQSLTGSIASSQVLKVKKSLGKVPVVDFTGKTKAEVVTWLAGVNGKSANITINYLSQAGGTLDEVVLQSTRTGYLNTGQTLTITLSTGI